MASLTGDSLILGHADELIAEYKAKLPPEVFCMTTLESRLAVTLEQIVRYIREDSQDERT